MDAPEPAAPDDDFRLRLNWPAADKEGESNARPEGTASGNTPIPSAVAAAVSTSDAAAEPASADVPMLPLLPAMAGRMESVHAALATLSIRIDALVAGINSLRSGVADQVSEYAQTVTSLGRTQAQEGEDSRRTTERMVSELRRSVSEADESVRRLASRFDDLTAELSAVHDLVRSGTAESREIATAAEKLARLVSDGLDTFGDRVLERLDELSIASDAETARTTAAVEDVREVVAGLAGVEQLREELTQATSDLTGPGAFDDLRADIAALHSAFDGRSDLGPAAVVPGDALPIDELADRIGARLARSGPTPTPPALSTEAVEALRAELAALREAVEIGQQPAAPDLDEERRQQLIEPVREELALLRRRLTVRAKAPMVLEDDELERMADAVESRLGRLALREEQLEAVVEGVVVRLAEMLEVVDDGERLPPSPSPPPAAPEPTSRSRWRR